MESSWINRNIRRNRDQYLVFEHDVFDMRGFIGMIVQDHWDEFRKPLG
jgi:hypothetical protein